MSTCVNKDNHILCICKNNLRVLCDSNVYISPIIMSTCVNKDNHIYCVYVRITYMFCAILMGELKKMTGILDHRLVKKCYLMSGLDR